jgi:hypothetical protein
MILSTSLVTKIVTWDQEHFNQTLNIIADPLATSTRNQHQINISDYILPHEEWSLYINNIKVCKNFKTRLYHNWSIPSMESFWKDKRGWTKETFSSINWDAIKDASSLWSKEKQRWVTKHCVGTAGVNQVLHNWKKSPSPICSKCTEMETTNHVWQCKGHDNHETWEKFFSKLETWVKKVDTCPHLKNTIIVNLQAWLDDNIPTTNRTTLEKFQDIIGWNYVIEGCLPTSWSEHQHHYYKKN